MNDFQLIFLVLSILAGVAILCVCLDDNAKKICKAIRDKNEVDNSGA